jgi:hypothetical protein
MMVVECPEQGRTLIGYRRLLAVVTVVPGVIVVHWRCPCGDEHLAATGQVAERDPARGAAAVAAVRARLAVAPMPGRAPVACPDDDAVRCLQRNPSGTDVTAGTDDGRLAEHRLLHR